jgi:predicted aspartyl protease
MLSPSLYDSISTCTLSACEIDPFSSHFRANVGLRGKNKSTTTAAMIDSGATGLFIDKGFAQRHRMALRPLKQPIRLHNIDGSNNTAGQITHFVRLYMTLGKYKEWTDFLVTNLGVDILILGLPWLRKVNPLID